MKNTIENREEKFAMVRRWESSGMNQKAFSEQEGIPTHHLLYWLKKYRDENSKTPSTGRFIKIAMPVNESPGSIYAEVVYQNGNRIRIHKQISTVELRQLAC